MGTRLGRYECRVPLHGPDLWVAHTDDGGARHVVLRLVDAEQTADPRFVRMSDAWVSGELSHPYIAEIEDIGEDGGRHYIATEYVHGEALVQALARLEERGKQLPLQHLLAIGSALAEALHHAHELGVHGAISPASVLLGYDGRIKVDLGRVGAAPRTGYRAPEAAQDRRSDVFSIGIVLFECATLDRLFKTDKPQRVPKPSSIRKGLPSEIEKIVLKALATDPAQRHATAEELRAALTQFATKAGMSFSADVVASYLKKLFPWRDEPWVTGGAPSGASRSFGAPALPSERAPTVASPARDRKITPVATVDPTAQTVLPSGDEFNDPTTVTPSPELDELKLVSRISGRRPAPTRPAAPPARPAPPTPIAAILARAGAVEAAGPDTEPIDPTMITSPPPPLVIASTTVEPDDSTAIVKPLPPPNAAPRARRPSTARALFRPGPDEADAVGARPPAKRKLLIGGGVALALLIPLVIVLWPASYPTTPMIEPVAARPSLPRPAADPEPALERVPAQAAVPVTTTESAPARAPVEPAKPDEPSVTAPSLPASVLVPREPASPRKPAAKPARKPVKVAAKPKPVVRARIAAKPPVKPPVKQKQAATKLGKVRIYDPDSLFPKRK